MIGSKQLGFHKSDRSNRALFSHTLVPLTKHLVITKNNLYPNGLPFASGCFLGWSFTVIIHSGNLNSILWYQRIIYFIAIQTFAFLIYMDFSLGCKQKNDIKNTVSVLLNAFKLQRSFYAIWKITKNNLILTSTSEKELRLHLWNMAEKSNYGAFSDRSFTFELSVRILVIWYHDISSL